MDRNNTPLLCLLLVLLFASALCSAGRHQIAGRDVRPCRGSLCAASVGGARARTTGALQACRDRCELACYNTQCERSTCKRRQVGYGGCEPDGRSSRRSCTSRAVYQYKCKCRKCGKSKRSFYIDVL